VNADALDDRDVDADAIEARMGSHVEGIMAAARKAAAQFQAEVERAASERAAQIETAAARRAHAVRMGAEDEAEQLVSQARAACQQYITASRRLVDEFARERMSRISEIGDRLAAHAEALIEPLARSDELARQLLELRNALGAAAERIAGEAARGTPPLPDLESPAARSDRPQPQDPVDAEIVDEGPASLEERLARATGRARRRLPTADELSREGEQAPPPADADGEGRDRADAS
jgi:hypothetical protein